MGGGGILGLEQEHALPPDVNMAIPAIGIDGLPPVLEAAELTELMVPRSETGNGNGVAAEAQDCRTAEVLQIVKGCLRTGGLGTAAFQDLVPPGHADRATAACTFAALLALAG